MKPEDAVLATLSSLPDEVVDTVGVTELRSEDSVSERRRKLEYLEMQEEMIKVCIFSLICLYSHYCYSLMCRRTLFSLLIISVLSILVHIDREN